MFSYKCILATLAVLTVLVYIWRLQGMPPELRNNVYEFVSMNTSMQARRVVSGNRLTAAYENTYAGQHNINFVRTLPTQVYELVAINIWGQERRPVSYKRLIAAYGDLHTKEHEVKLVRTNLLWHLGRVPMANILVPVVDVASILLLATARHPLSKTSSQLYTEFQSFDKQGRGGEYLFILNNFDPKQMGIIAASIHAIDTEARARNPPDILHFHVCFTFDNNAVSSAKKLCSWSEETNTVPLGLEYIAHKMTKIQVKTGLTPRQADRVHWMSGDLRHRRNESEVAGRPIRAPPTVTEKIVTTLTVSSTSTPTTTITSAITCTPPAAPVFVKRAATVAKPSCLAAFTVPAAISSACKCLSVPTSTATVTTKLIVPTTTTVTEGSIVTETFTPTSTITQTGVPITVKVATATQTETVDVPLPAQTVTVYVSPERIGAPFKIQTFGAAGAALFLSSSRSVDPYTFGGSGNVFRHQPDSRVPFDPIGLRDQTLGRVTVSDDAGRVFPGDFGYFVFCTIQLAAGEALQQTCPLTCRSAILTSPANWNCGGQWFSRNTGSCSTFQAYAISQ
ncbi:hypothetical protein MBLNU13_g07250t3 [Cladosporium sp. NU13]